MEHYEDYPWCPYSDHSGGETDDERRRHPHLSQVRTRSVSRSRHRSSFLVDELDMLMDKAATTIQAAWRGFLVRKRVWTENKAAGTIQAAWRRFITREYIALQKEQPPSWQVCGQACAHRPKEPSPTPSEDRRPSGTGQDARREEAATVIQAHYRGYVTRRVLFQCNRAATTIQAHWRGYSTRQDLARGLTRRTYPSGIPSGTYYSRPRPIVGAPARLSPYPRKHWRKCLVGTPEEWRSKVPSCPKQGERAEQQAPQAKSCPKCGRCTTVRVLEGVGKGPPFESDSEFEGSSHRPSYTARRRSPGPRARRRQKSPQHHTCGVHLSYQGSAEDQPRRQGREPGGLSQRYPSSHTAVRPSKERPTSRSQSSTSVHHCQQGPPAPGTSDWLYENYCAHRMGEGQRRVFKTRKHMWEVARAATCIQAFWRGWKARQALRQQQQAATKIQSVYRGYRTRVYLIDAGILSEGYATD